MRTSVVTKIVLCAVTCCVLSFLAAAGGVRSWLKRLGLTHRQLAAHDARLRE